LIEPAIPTADEENVQGLVGKNPEPDPTVRSTAETPAEVPTESRPDTIAETPVAPETAPEPAAVPANPASAAQPSIDARRAAWRLGSRLSLATLANDRGISPDDVPTWFEQAKAMAQMLNLDIPDLPPRPSTPQTEGVSPEALRYLRDQVKSINAQLAADHGAEAAALFDLAVKSNLLLIYSDPASSALSQISKAISSTAPHTGVPAATWQPLIDALANRAAPAAVRQAVKQLHVDVDAYLAAATEQ
jgi:hypothetical protein